MTVSDAWTAADVSQSLRRPTGTDDKYSRGVLGVRTGSMEYPGAAVLGVEAAWRTGLGMVRYLGPARPADLVLQRRPETVTTGGRVQAWLVGSGTDAGSRSHEETTALRGLLAGILPVVVDAGALDLAPEATAPVVVTPHAREHARLRAALGLPGGDVGSDAGRRDAAQETADALGAVVVLKGAVTLVAAPGDGVIDVPVTTSWLATAGTGDVLGGILGALVAAAVADAGLAAGERVGADVLARCAASAAWLHARAAALAAFDVGDGPITALDVAAALPRAVAGVLAGQS